MQKSLLILVTSIKEGWGLIVTEAASQGTPAVVYDVDGLRDSVYHSKTGLITTSNTPIKLAEAIKSLLYEPAKFEQIQYSAWKVSHSVNFDQSYQDFLLATAIIR